VRNRLLHLQMRKVGDDSYKLVFSAYPPDWRKRRKLVLRRDRFTCQDCGGSDPVAELEVHHRVPISDGGSHELNNLVTLCDGCHDGRH